MVKNKNNETNRTEQTTPMMTMRIGNTTYEVNFHFSKTSWRRKISFVRYNVGYRSVSQLYSFISVYSDVQFAVYKGRRRIRRETADSGAVYIRRICKPWKNTSL